MQNEEKRTSDALAEYEMQKQKRGMIILAFEGVILAVLLVVAAIRFLPVRSAPPTGMAQIGSGSIAVTSPSSVIMISPTDSEAEVGGETEETGVPVVLDNKDFVQSDDWRLILVNADHPLPEDYSVKLKTLRNDYRVDERIYPDLQKMFDAARYDGIFPLIHSAYRTAEYQQTLLDNKLATLAEQGMTGDEAMKEALHWIAAPGTSEHQLGLAIDITTEGADDTLESVYNWLENNSWKYGFIRRYPSDKSDITGIGYEPWHYRYVGKDAAKEIFEAGICLEEYLGAA